MATPINLIAAVREIDREYGDGVVLIDNAGAVWEASNFLEALAEAGIQEAYVRQVIRLEASPRHESIIAVDDHGYLFEGEPVFIVRPTNEVDEAAE